MYKDSQFTFRDNTCFSINAIGCFMNMSVHDNKYVDPVDMCETLEFMKLDMVSKIKV